MSNIPLKSRPAQAPTVPWRNVLPVHPAAELLPRPSIRELADLADDIRHHGQQVEIAIFTGEDGIERLLDGISRLDAMESIGLPIIKDEELNRDVVRALNVPGNVNPVAYVLSANVHRRHLTSEQKREVIAGSLKANPDQSNRTIAKQVKSDHKTVGAVREKLESRGEIPHVETRTDSKGREQPAKKSKPPKAEQKVLENPQEAHSVVEIREVEEEEKPIKATDEAPFEALNKQFTTILKLCEHDSYWPRLNPSRQKRREKAMRKLGDAWSELVDIAKPGRGRGRPRKTVVEA